MKHPLKCPNCDEYRYIEYEGVRFEDEKTDRGFGVSIPMFKCRACGQFESILPQEPFMKFMDEIMPSIHPGEFFDMPLKFIFSKLDSEKRFKQFDNLEFNYDPRDNYLIPGLYREWDDGYLTPVFFDKDLLLYYNNHPDYSVKLTSFSSGNIYYKGKSMFEWGFGINRNGKIFKWLGDLNKDFRSKKMKAHLKRFQASNIPSDHDVVSKFYLSQNPFSISDAFQTSDNESRLFYLLNKFSIQIKNDYGIELTKIDIDKLSDYYRSPILEDREQIFNAYLSLNKYLIENLQEEDLRNVLQKSGLNKNDFEQNGKKIGSLKLFTLLIGKVLGEDNPEEMISPLFVLNDLRQLHSHLSKSSFNEKYKSCKKRLNLSSKASDIVVFRALVSSIIVLFQKLVNNIE